MTQGRPLLNRRLAEFGTTIFAEMSALSRLAPLPSPHHAGARAAMSQDGPQRLDGYPSENGGT